MKRFFALFTVLFLLANCDDGNIEAASFDFAEAKVASCGSGTANFFIYNAKDKRTFIIKIAESNFKNLITPSNNPIVLKIDNASNKVIYREYSDNISSETLCAAIPVSTPTVSKEWVAVGGNIVIKTTVVKVENTDGSSTISGYNHSISFENIAFETGNGQQKNDLIEFGKYFTSAVSIVNFTTLQTKNCGTNTFFYKYSSNQAMSLLANSSLFDTNILGTPKTQFIDNLSNKLVYNIYNPNSGTLTDDYFCSTTLPVFPTIFENWIADNGADTNGFISGQIEVTTASNGVGKFSHTIVLKNIHFSKGEIGFKLASKYVFGIYND